MILRKNLGEREGETALILKNIQKNYGEMRMINPDSIDWYMMYKEEKQSSAFEGHALCGMLL